MKTSGMIKMLIKISGWPKFYRSLLAIGFASLFASGITGCSSTEGEEGIDEEVVEEGSGSEEAATAEAGGETVPENEAVVESGTNGSMGGNNTIAVENPTGINSAGLTNTGGNAAALAAEDPAAMAVNTDPSAAAPVDPAASAPTDPAASANAPVTPVATGPGLALPAGTSAVVYVSGESATIYDAPNGKQVGGMVRGDFVLASAEGEWAKTHDGKYVRASELSTKPVGRKRTRSEWHSAGK